MKRLNVITKTETLKLEAIDKIWLIFNNVKQDKVIKVFSHLLAEVYTSVGKSLEEEQGLLIDKLMENISQQLHKAQMDKN